VNNDVNNTHCKNNYNDQNTQLSYHSYLALIQNDKFPNRIDAKLGNLGLGIEIN